MSNRQQRLNESTRNHLVPTQPFQSYDDDVFAAMAAADGDPTMRLDIMSIWADPQQPRRAIPNSVRVYWSGDPAKVVDLLMHWQKVAEQKAGATIPVLEILNGQGEGLELESAHPHLAEFIDLTRLAQSIHREGLINPISVIRRGDSHVIESGERRWLAHHLLNHFMDEKYGKIPAIESKSGESVWRQARENTARRSLNAIGMARQLALLVMDLRAAKTDYNRFEDIVEGCDRIFYEQVSNAQLHSIPKGMGERVESAMGVKKKQVSDYRKLLRLTEDHEVNDILWLRGDEENWGLDPLVEIGKLPLDTLRRIVVDNPSFTFNDLIAETRKVWSPHLSQDSQPVGDSAKPTPPPKNQLLPGVIILRRLGDYWRIEDADYMNDEFLCVSPSGFSQRIKHADIAGIDNAKADLFKRTTKPEKQPANPPRQEAATPVDFEVGQRVIIDGNPNIRGTVANKSMGRYQVNLLSGGSRWFEKERLTPVVDVPDTEKPRPAHRREHFGAQGGNEPDDDDYTTPLAADEFEDEGDSVGDTPKPIDMQLVIQKLADMAALMDLPEQPILDDLAKLNRERLEVIIQDGGSDLLEQLTNGYYKAATDAVDKIGKYLHAYIDEIVAAGRKIIEES